MSQVLEFAQLSSIVKDVTEWVARFDENATHAMRLVYWAKKITTDPSDVIFLACLLHDIEYAFPIGRNPSGSCDSEDCLDGNYLVWHAGRSAKFARELLEERGVEETVIDQVCEIIKLHEFGGNKEADIVMNADSIAFLEMHAMLMCDWEPSDESCNQAHKKIQFMYDRINDDYARDLAKPYYEKSLTQLKCEIPV